MTACRFAIACLLVAACGGGHPAADAALPDGTPCTAETDAELCTLAGAECGELQVTDRCGSVRDVVSCGTCSQPDFCGGSGVANACGPETWFDLGGSDFGPWYEMASFGSAQGSGLSNSARTSQGAVLASSGSDAWMAWSAGPLHVVRSDGGRWTDISPGPGVNMTGLAIAASPSGLVVVGRSEDDLRAMRFAGGWSDLGAINTTPLPSSSIRVSVAIDGSDRPVVAWSDGASGAAEIFAVRHEGTAWLQLGTGSVSETAGDSARPSVAIAPTGEPWIAWEDDTRGNYSIYVRRFDGTSWVEAGVGSATDTGISGASTFSIEAEIGFDGSGRATAAWRHREGDDHVMVRAFDGSTWQPVGSTIGTTSAEMVQLAFDGDGRPLVAYRHPVAQGMDAFVVRFDGATWQDLGPPATGPGAPLGIDLASTGAGTLLAWDGDPIGDVYNARFDGVAWASTTPITAGDAAVSDPALNSLFPDVAHDSTGRPVVAWMSGFFGSAEIYLERFDGASWAELGGSSTGGGISQTPAGASQFPRVAVDQSDRPLVVWEEWVASREQIYFARWTGSAWEELAGSASGGGVSNSTAGAVRPAVAVDSANRPVVAWLDEIGAIYVAAWDGLAWVEVGAGSLTGTGLSAGAPHVGLDLVRDSADRLVLAWIEGGAPTALRFEGGAWSPLPAPPDAASSYQSIHLDAAATGELALGGLSSPGAYAARFDGASWTDLSPPITAPGDAAAIAIADGGDVWITWAAPEFGLHEEVRVLRHDGNGWNEVGAGSAAGRGISNTAGPSLAPVVSVGGAETCVAWHDIGSAWFEIVVRCTNTSP